MLRGDIARLLENLEVGRDLRSAALWEIAASMHELSSDELGCCVVQRALELAGPAQASALVATLRGRVVRTASLPYGHFVLEQAVRTLPADGVAFIAEEITPHAFQVATNRYACDVLCRLLEFSADDPRTCAAVDAALAEDPHALCCSKVGHVVAMSVLSNGTRCQRDRLLKAITTDIQRLCRHRFAHLVVAAALRHCDLGEDEWFSSVILRTKGTLEALACHVFGVEVVRAILDVDATSAEVAKSLVAAKGKLAKDRYGITILREIGACPLEEVYAPRAHVGGA